MIKVIEKYLNYSCLEHLPIGANISQCRYDREIQLTGRWKVEKENEVKTLFLEKKDGKTLFTRKLKTEWIDENYLRIVDVETYINECENDKQ